MTVSDVDLAECLAESGSRSIEDFAQVIPLQRDSDRSEAGIRHFTCCGLRIAALGPVQAVNVLRERAVRREGGGVHLCNTFTVKLARQSESYRELLSGTNMNLADGAPVAWVGRKQGHRAMELPVRGPGLMDDVLRDGLAWGAKHYLYGSTPEVIERLRQMLPAKYPGIQIVGLESPPFRELDATERAGVRRRFAESGAHFVWVGLGTPKQDQFVSEFAPGSSALLVAVGAAFDFAAGTVKEAPDAMHGSGFEWVYRLAKEPRRLAGRYARSAMLIPDLIRSAYTRRERAASTPASPAAADFAS